MKAKIWVRIAATLQILTGLIHSIALVSGLQPQNEKEKELIDLMRSYKQDMEQVSVLV